MFVDSSDEIYFVMVHEWSGGLHHSVVVYCWRFNLHLYTVPAISPQKMIIQLMPTCTTLLFIIIISTFGASAGQGLVSLLYSL